jgi:hypothetical protein
MRRRGGFASTLVAETGLLVTMATAPARLAAVWMNWRRLGRGVDVSMDDSSVCFALRNYQYFNLGKNA